MQWLKYVGAVSLLAIAFFLGMMVMPQAEAQTNEVTVTYHPEVGSVCFSGKGWGICDHWTNFIEPGMFDTRQEAWNSIFGENSIYNGSIVY